MKRLFFPIVIAACAFAQTPPPAPAGQAAPPALKDGLYAVFNTQMGTITAELYESATPLTVKNFVGLAKGTKGWMDPKTHALVKRPLYNNIVFHRVMLDQMIQAGDPTGKGDHECGFTIKDEVRPELKFDRPGRLAMANRSAPNTGACQWFITQTVAPPWDGQYTIFGQVVEGQDVVKAISRVPVNHDGTFRPKDPPKLISVTIKRVGAEPAAAKAPAGAKKTAPAAKKK